MKKKSFKMSKELAAIMQDAHMNKMRNLFSLAMEQPESIDEEKIRQGYIFPFNDPEKAWNEAETVLYEALGKSGIDKDRIFAIKYANDRTGRLCVPTKDKPCGISKKKWEEWLSLYDEGLELAKNKK